MSADGLLSGKVIAITGGFGALGDAVRASLQAQGAKVALIDVAPDKGGEGDLRLGGVDITQIEAARAAVAEIGEKLGAIDGLVNVAGGFRWETLEDGDLGTWDLMYTMNVRTAATMCKAVVPALKARGAGRIVNIGANGAVKAGMGMGSYAASKSGVAKLTEALAEELKGSGITVNAVLPSIIDTPANRRDMADADFSKWVAPADLAAVIAFLLSDHARAVTGALVPVTHLV